MAGSHGGCGNLVENAEVGGCVGCAGCVRDFQNKFYYILISPPVKHLKDSGHTWYKLGVSEADIMIYYTLG